MPTNLEEVTTNKKSANVAGYSPKRLDNWVNAINMYQVKLNQPLLDFNKDEIINNVKSFTGANAATGSGLVETRVDTPITYVGVNGGVFIAAGVDYKANQGFNPTVNSFSLSGSYAQIACGTDTENEISTFTTGTATLMRERAEIQGCEDIIARTPDRASLINMFEQALEEEKLVLADKKAAAAITSNASVVAVNTIVASQGEITLAMLEMQKDVGTLVSRPSRKQVYMMNNETFVRFLQEQTTTGALINNVGFAQGQFTPSYSNDRPSEGLMGYFGGYKVYVTEGILSTYTVNGSNAITAQTGGSKSAILFGLPYTLGVYRGLSEYDDIVVFDTKNDRQSYYEGEITVGAATYMAAVLKAPVAWTYYAV